MKTLFIISAILFCNSLNGQDHLTQIARTDNVNVSLSADSSLLISMDLVLPENLKVSSNHMMIFTPLLHAESKETPLPPIYVYGRKREIISKRKNRLPEEGTLVLNRTNRKEQVINYETSLPYESWMKGADVMLEQDLCGCGNESEKNIRQQLAQVSLPEPEVVLPEIAYRVPEAEAVKRRIYKGKAFIDFPINEITIYPDYRRNVVELARIDSTLEGFKTREILSIQIYGYASPEGTYARNTYLARERTQALKQYIIRKFEIRESVVTAEFTPEDWVGFIQLASQCDLKEKDRILEIARSNMDPDEKEKQLKLMADAYQYMNRHWFPALRHTDYQIEYRIPDFTPEQARIMVRQDPAQLSLREMYDAAQLCGKGSEEYYSIMETAVRVYPDSPEANLNAAAMELERGNLSAAKEYLKKADMDTHEAKDNMQRIILLENNKQ